MRKVTIATTLLIVGGQQQSLRPLHVGKQGWYRYSKGVILQLQLANQEVSSLLDYESPSNVCPPENPAILFKSGTIADDTLYVCTQTEVLIYRLPDCALLHYITLPQFNDVHHVRPTPAGTLLVVNTGLDMLMELTVNGEVVREWSAIGEDPWTRFSRSVDYRRVASTKPHLAHPNYCFYVGSEVWITRFEQRDAICITSPEKRIDIGLERVHDGYVHGGKIYFSTVDGKIVIVDQSSLRVEEIFDLNEAARPDDLLGWCRGVFVEDGMIWVGFSRLRPTKFRENISWVANGFKRSLPTRVACYDLASRRCVASVDLEELGMNAVFSVLPHHGLLSSTGASPWHATAWEPQAQTGD
jgi:hypothetical protein